MFELIADESPIRVTVRDLLAADSHADDDHDPGLDDCGDLNLCAAHGHSDCAECPCEHLLPPDACGSCRLERREAVMADRWLADAG